MHIVTLGLAEIAVMKDTNDVAFAPFSKSFHMFSHVKTALPSTLALEAAFFRLETMERLQTLYIMGGSGPLEK